MMLGDIVHIDDDGYLRVIGRAEDFIIRGGKVAKKQLREDIAGGGNREDPG